MALIYHDLVYKAHRKDNEAKSAALAVRDLAQLGASAQMTNRCQALIMATKTHQPTNADEGLLVDLDLAVLARPAAGYDAYSAAVRQEFAVFPDFLYRPGRKKALQHLLHQTHIYYHPDLRDRWEETARANLKRELQRL